MTDRYGTFNQRGITCGVIDRENGDEYHTINLGTADRLAKLLNCRAKREADYLQGWVDRDRDCPITESGKRCAKRYVDGAESGLKNPLKKKEFTASGTPILDEGTSEPRFWRRG